MSLSQCHVPLFAPTVFTYHVNDLWGCSTGVSVSGCGPVDLGSIPSIPTQLLLCHDGTSNIGTVSTAASVSADTGRRGVTLLLCKRRNRGGQGTGREEVRKEPRERVSRIRTLKRGRIELTDSQKHKERNDHETVCYLINTAW